MKYLDLHVLLFFDFLIDSSKDEVLSEALRVHLHNISFNLVGCRCHVKNYLDWNFKDFIWDTQFRFYGFDTTYGIRCIVRNLLGKETHYFGPKDVRLILD